MQLQITNDYQGLSRVAARIVAQRILAKPNLVLGLATGKTPIGMYEELVALYRQGLMDFSSLVTFNVDELFAIPANHPLSYHRYMEEHLFQRVNINRRNIHMPPTITSDVNTVCREYEQQIVTHGGLDLQILGIGHNGHIGFNEPGSDWGAATHLVTLTEETRVRLAGHAMSLTEIPRQAITVGVKTIMRAKEILLLANGPEKAMIVRQALQGPISTDVPASILQLHPRLTVLLDRDAAEGLSNFDNSRGYQLTPTRNSNKSFPFTPGAS